MLHRKIRLLKRVPVFRNPRTDFHGARRPVATVLRGSAVLRSMASRFASFPSVHQTYKRKVVPRRRAVSAAAGLRAVRRLVACALAFAATGGFAMEPFTLGGHTLGQRADTVMADPQYDCGGLSGCFLFEACSTDLESGHGEFMNVPIEGLTLYITGERISGIEASFAEPEFERVLAALQEEYGSGEAADDATPGNVVRIWRKGSRVLRIERLLRPDRSSVIVAERNILSELTGR
ncbi:MAG: hypothetical protein WDZ63_08200 [Burkholderiales bacterium]